MRFRPPSHHMLGTVGLPYIMDLRASQMSAVTCLSSAMYRVSKSIVVVTVLSLKRKLLV